MAHKLNKLAEQLVTTTADLQKQRDADARLVEHRLQQLDHRLELWQAEGGRSIALQEKWAETRGGVRGLFEEVQKLARRLEGFDEHVRSHTSGLDFLKERSQQLERKVQALAHDRHFGTEAAELTEKSHAVKLKQMERALEALGQRVTRTEEAVVPRAGKPLGAPVLREIQELRQRVYGLEEKCEEPIAESLKHTQVAICDTVLQVSELTQRTAESDRQLAILRERLDQFPSVMQNKDGNGPALLHETTRNTTADGSRVSQQMAQVMERLLEFESHCNIDEARDESASEMSLDARAGSQKVDQALQRLHCACLKAAEDISETVKRELQEIHQDEAVSRELLELQGQQDSYWECPSLSQHTSQQLLTQESCRSDSESCSKDWTD